MSDDTDDEVPSGPPSSRRKPKKRLLSSDSSASNNSTSPILTTKRKANYRIVSEDSDSESDSSGSSIVNMRKRKKVAKKIIKKKYNASRPDFWIVDNQVGQESNYIDPIEIMEEYSSTTKQRKNILTKSTHDNNDKMKIAAEKLTETMENSTENKKSSFNPTKNKKKYSTEKRQKISNKIQHCNSGKMDVTVEKLNETVETMKKLCDILSKKEKKNEKSPSHLFGRYIASKMKGYSENIRSIVQQAINNVLFHADVGNYDTCKIRCNDISSPITPPNHFDTYSSFYEVPESERRQINIETVTISDEDERSACHSSH